MKKLSAILSYVAFVMFILLLVALTVSIQYGARGSEIILKDGKPTALRRVTDTEAGIVCFYVALGRGAGMDCVPLSDTNLAKR